MVKQSAAYRPVDFTTIKSCRLDQRSETSCQAFFFFLSFFFSVNLLPNRVTIHVRNYPIYLIFDGEYFCFPSALKDTESPDKSADRFSIFLINKSRAGKTISGCFLEEMQSGVFSPLFFAFSAD